MNVASYMLLAAAAAVSLHACTNDDTAHRARRLESSSEALIPLAPGKQWTYAYSRYDSLGNRLSVSPTRTVVSGDTVVGGQRWYGLQDEALPGRGFEPTYTANRPGGLYMLGRNGEEILLYKYPAVPGDLCPPFTVISTDTSITCPAGTFRCYVYQDTATYTARSGKALLVTTRDFISPGTGLIRHEVTTLWRAAGGGPDVPGPGEVSEAASF